MPGYYLDLMRHAQAEPDNRDGDAARELAHAGREALASLGSHIRSLDPQPGYILCSSATRTVQTMESIRPFLPDTLVTKITHSLYNAGTGTIYELIKGLSDHHQTAMLIGHNPGMSEIVNFLCATPLSLKPGDYVRLQVDTDHWSAVMPVSARIEWHLRPGNRT